MQTSQTMCMITNLSSYLEGLNMLATYGLFALSISETFWDDWRSLSCSFLGWLNQWSNQKIHKTLFKSIQYKMIRESLPSPPFFHPCHESLMRQDPGSFNYASTVKEWRCARSVPALRREVRSNMGTLMPLATGHWSRVVFSNGFGSG